MFTLIFSLNVISQSNQSYFAIIKAIFNSNIQLKAWCLFRLVSLPQSRTAERSRQGPGAAHPECRGGEPVQRRGLLLLDAVHAVPGHRQRSEVTDKETKVSDASPFNLDLCLRFRERRPAGRNAEEVWAFPAPGRALPRLPLHPALHGEDPESSSLFK